MKKNLLPAAPAAALARAWSAPALLVVLLTSAISTQAADFTSTWNNTTTGNWTDTTKWSTPGAPANTFPNNAIPGPSPKYDAVQSGGAITVNQSITIEKYDLSTGNNIGAGFTLTLNDLMTWSGGFIIGSGTINANGGATFSGDGTKYLADRVVNLSGISTWSAGNLEFFVSSLLVNKLGGDFTTTSGGTMITVNGGSFTNEGTFTKSGGAGPTTISVPFTNSGTMKADSGVLSLNGNGTHSGTLAAGAGGILQFAGNSTHILNAGSSFSGAGTVSLPVGSTLSVNAAVSSTASTVFSLSGGAVGGSGTLTLNGPLTWTSGVFNGSATHANGGATLSGAGEKSIGLNQVMNLGGISTWSEGNIGFYQSSSLVNKLGATLTTTFGGNMNSAGGGGLVFTNAGIFTKNTSSATTTIGIPFNNTGTVNVDTGTLSMTGGTSSGAWNVAAGATLTFAAGTHILNEGSSFSGAGTVSLPVGGTLSVNAAVSSTASTVFSMSGGAVGGSGTLTLNGPLTWSSGVFGGSATHANGGATLSGPGEKSIGLDQVMNLGGISTWSEGNIGFYQSSSLVNKLGATLTTTFGGNMNSAGGGGLVFTNAGTFTKNTSSAPTTIGIPFNNTGTVNVESGSIIFNSTYTQTAGALVLKGGNVSRTNSTDLFTVRGSKIQGGGTITGGVTSSGGSVTIEPGISGTSTGTLAISGDLTLTPGSKLSFDIGGTMAGTQHDKITETGTTAPSVSNVTLEVALMGNYFPGPLDTFIVLDASHTITGNFANVANGARLSTVDGKGSFKVNYGSGTAIAGGNADKVILSDFQTVPTSITLDDNQIAENAPLGAVVGLLDAEDLNTAATFTFSLVAGAGDTGNGQFQISGNQLQAKPGLDFETQTSYSIRVRVENNSGGILVQNLTIEVQDVPNPSTLALSANSISESMPIDTVIGALSATDPTPGATFTFALVAGTGDMDNGKFNLSGTSLRSSEVFDFEAAPGPFSIRARVTNNGGETLEQIFSITLINEGLTNFALSPAAVQENLPVGTSVGTLSATVTPVGTAVTYELVTGEGSTDNALFTVDGTTIKTAAVLDFEAAPTRSIRVKATDANGEIFEKALVITVTDVTTPTVLALSANAISENQPINTVIGTLSATDPNAEATFTFTLVSGTGDTDNARFNISGTSLRSSEILDFETTPGPFSLRARVTNNGGEILEQIFSITLINEGVTDFVISSSTVQENLPIGTAVGTLSATVTPVGTMVNTYVLVTGEGSTDNDLFTVDGTTIKTAAVLDFEVAATRSIRVKATDANGETFEKALTITVTDVTTPTALALSSSSIAENQPIDTVIGTLSATDPNTEATFTFTLVSGTGDTDNARFNISGTSLRSSQVFDFDATPGPFSLRARVTNNGGETLEQIFAITLNDGGVSDIALSASTERENLPAGATVGTLSSTVVPVDTAVTYALVTGEGSTDNALFTADGSTIKTTATLDFEAAATRSIRVKATDANGETFEKVFTITVTDVPAPTTLALSANSISENRPINTFIGTFSATDPDSESTFTFALVSGSGSTHNHRFQLVGPNGSSIHSNQVFNAEAHPGPFGIRVSVTNSGGESREQNFSIQLVDEGVTSIALSPGSVLENSPVGTAAGTLSAIVTPEGTAVSYALVESGSFPDNSLFTIDGDTVNVAAGAVLDFEAGDTRSLRILATDANGETHTQTVVVTLQNIPNPTDIALSADSIAENQPDNTVVGTLNASDPNPEATFTFAIVSGSGDTHNALFNLSGSALRTTGILDFESLPQSLNIRLRVLSSLGETYEEPFAITLTDQGPSSIALAPGAILEGKPVGSSVGSLTSTVVPEGSTVTYTLVTGTGDTNNSQFQIVENALKVAEKPVFNGATRSIRVRATGPGTEIAEQVFTITILDAGPPTDIALSASSIAENQPINTVIGALSGTDPDAEAVLSFSLVDTANFPDNARFNLHTDLGVTSLRSSEALDFETTPGPFSIRLRVTNEASEFYEETFAITLTDQGPSALTLSPNFILEGRPIGTTVGNLSATTVVPAGTAISTFELVAGINDTDNALFSVDGTAIKTAAVLDHEVANLRRIRVKATDANGESREFGFFIGVGDVDLIDITLSATSVFENLPAGTLIANLGAVLDLPDPGATPTFSIVSATPNDAVTITGTQLVTTRPLLRSANPTIALRLHAEHLGESFEENVTITVNANAATLVVQNPPGTNVTTLNVGDLALGTSTTRTVTLRNNGPGHAFNVSILNPTAPNNAASATSTALATDDDLSPGESVAVDITFTALALGNHNSSIIFESDNASDRTLAVTGRGTGAEIAMQQPLGVELVDGAAQDFGRLPFGLPSPARTFVVKNVGSVTSLDSVSATITGPDAAFFDLDTQGFASTSTIAAGESSTFRVKFQPDALRTYNATLRITSTDADENPFDIPLTGEGVTPLMIAQMVYAKSSDTINSLDDNFGDSVAVSGNTVVVGSPRSSNGGTVFVFVRDAVNGAWSQQDKLVSTSPTRNAFGTSVAISGDTIVVGDTSEDSGSTGVNGDDSNSSAQNSGAAYVFQRSDGVWTQQAYLKASNTEANDQFGTSVAISGDTIIVGAAYEDSASTGVNGGEGNTPGFNEAGAAYVFQRSGETWTQQAYLKASNTDGQDYFGGSVAVSGDTIVVGARGEMSSSTGVNGNQGNTPGFAIAGAAYVFQRTGGAWAQQAYLKASNTGVNDFFGTSVAISGDTIVVGAERERSGATGVNGDQGDSSDISGAGAAYVFQRSGGAWVQQAYLKASNTNSLDYFGGSVAISGDMIIVGAEREDSGSTGLNGDGSNTPGFDDSGAAYVFQRSGGAWALQAYLKASNTGGDDRFGASVAVAGNLLVAGALGEDSAARGINGVGSDNDATGSGAAYIFEVIPPQVIVHDGPDTGSARLADNQAQAVDYGPTPLGITVTKQFTIQNLRFEALTVSSITAPADLFTVVSAPSTIPAQSSAVFSLRLNALTLGTNSGNVTITTNDAANPEFVFPITGEVLTLAPGTFDPRFGTGGIVRVDFGANDRAFDMLMLPDGRLVLGGDRVGGSVSQFALARLLPTGVLDTSFDGDGKVETTVPGVLNPSITGVCLQDDKIVAVGTRELGNAWFSVPFQPSFALVRYLSDGSLDSTFGTAGFDIDNRLTEGDFTGHIVVNPGGKLLVAGMQTITGGFRPYVRRFNKNGGRDAGFGTNGTTVLDIGSYGGAITVNATGEIFTAGSSSAGSGGLARLWKLSATGAELDDLTFPKAAPPGYPLEASTGDGENATAVALQADGKPVIAAKRSGSFTRELGGGFITGRATTELEADLSYNGTGVTIEDIDPAVSREQANSIAVQADGKLVVAGQVGGKWVVVRYTPAGELDPSFGTGGKVVLDLGSSGSAYKVLLDAAGDIYVAGHAHNSVAGNQDFVVVKLIGSIDPYAAMTVRSGPNANAPKITNGQSTAFSFGTARIGGSTVSNSFRVENSGTIPLTIDNVTVPTGFRFSVASSTPSIAAGGSGKVTVLMPTNTLGTFSGPVTIHSNDPVQGVFTFPISGEVKPNDPPIFAGFIATTNQGEKSFIGLSKLVASVSDANGDQVMVTGFSPDSLVGADITFDGLETLTYDPPEAFFGVDQFSVTFSDGEAEIVGVVSVNVTQDPAFNPKNAPKLEPLPGGLAISFTGIPRKVYKIQRSTDLLVWTQIGTATASNTGVVRFNDPAPPQPSAFYRITF